MQERTKIIAEIGINHNGDIGLAKRLIDVASISGCDFVKFQKRNPDIAVPDNQKNVIRDTPWGKMKYIDYKYRMEFDKTQYTELFDYCESKNIGMFASVWDNDSVEFMSDFTDMAKIPSAKITDDGLCKYSREKFGILMISTGMSDESQIQNCIRICDPDVIMHTNSTYPSPVDELNLSYIKWLSDHTDAEIGYSGHEYGLVSTFASVAMGATWIERHITLDRTMWGSDQLASVEPIGLMKLVKGIRDIEKSIGEYGERKLMPSELSKLKSLRG